MYILWFFFLRYSEKANSVQQEETLFNIQFVRLDCSPLKSSLVQHCIEWQTKFTQLLSQIASTQLKELYDSMQENANRWGVKLRNIILWGMFFLLSFILRLCRHFLVKMITYKWYTLLPHVTLWISWSETLLASPVLKTCSSWLEPIGNNQQMTNFMLGMMLDLVWQLC